MTATHATPERVDAAVLGGLVELSASGSGVVAADGTFVHVNPAGAAILGTTPATGTETHDFSALGRDHRVDDEELSAFQLQQQLALLQEDVDALEIEDGMVASEPDGVLESSIRSDVAGVRRRRLLTTMAAREAAAAAEAPARRPRPAAAPAPAPVAGA
jgi:vanillate O-demethylase monooxygenase subunit